MLERTSSEPIDNPDSEDTAVSPEVIAELVKVAKSSSPSEVNLRVKRIVTQELTRRETFSGPLPHPDHLLRYKEVLPGLESKIVEHFEIEQSHRHFMEKTMIGMEKRNTGIGLFLGGMVSVALIGGASFCAWINQKEVGIALVGAAAVSMVPHLINGWRKKFDQSNGAPPQGVQKSKGRRSRS